MWIDWLFIAVFAGAWPAFENLFRLPHVKAAIAAQGSPRRIREYRLIMVLQWSLVAIALALVGFGGRSWASVGLTLPHGAGLWWTIGIVVALALLLRMQGRAATGTDAGRAAVSRQLAPLRWFLPANGPELANFRALSVTAGVCEEILYRGYLMAVLLPFGGLGVAVVVSSLLFGLAHSYQGVGGAVKAGVLGALMAGMYVLTGSLLAPMIVHAMVDWSSGQIAADVPSTT